MQTGTTLKAKNIQLECGPMPNVMATLPNIGGTLCSTPQFGWRPLLVPCSNAAKTRNPLKFAGVLQTHQQISAASGPSSPCCVDMWRRYCCLTSFFLIVNTCLSCEDTARQTCVLVRTWTQSEFCTWQELPKMYIQCTNQARRLPNIVQSSADFR